MEVKTGIFAGLISRFDSICSFTQALSSSFASGFEPIRERLNASFRSLASVRGILNNQKLVVNGMTGQIEEMQRVIENCKVNKIAFENLISVVTSRKEGFDN